MAPEICPRCGSEVPPHAKASPECGSDERTGWSEEARTAESWACRTKSSITKILSSGSSAAGSGRGPRHPLVLVGGGNCGGGSVPGVLVWLIPGPMRLQILRDLHLEFAPFRLPEVAADVLVLAGDIGVGEAGLKSYWKTAGKHR